MKLLKQRLRIAIWELWQVRIQNVTQRSSCQSSNHFAVKSSRWVQKLSAAPKHPKIIQNQRPLQGLLVQVDWLWICHDLIGQNTGNQTADISAAVLIVFAHWLSSSLASAGIMLQDALTQSGWHFSLGTTYHQYHDKP